MEGALHHVMVRGLEKRKIFLSDRDREDLMNRFSEVLPKAGARLFGWSFLPNHFHLLLRTGSVPLSSVMRRILTGYAISFNLRHRRSGHLFQNRYKSILVEEEPYLLELIRYIHLNPIRASLVKNIDELNSYPWSGHATMVGKFDRSWQDSKFVLEQFGKRLREARRNYTKFVAEKIGEGRRQDLAGGGLIRSMGGWDKVGELKRGREKWAHDERVLGSSEFVERILIEKERGGKKVGEKRGEEFLLSLVEKIVARLRLTRAELIGGSRRRRVVEGRNLISFVAVRGYGMKLKQAAKLLNVSPQSVLRGLETGEKGFLERAWSFEDLK